MDEPDKRVFYRKEPGCNFQTLMTDCVVQANFMQALACYENVEILSKLLPEFYEIKWLKKATDSKGMMSAKQKFPWPLRDREMYYHVTGVADYKNKGLITVSKSKYTG